MYPPSSGWPAAWLKGMRLEDEQGEGEDGSMNVDGLAGPGTGTEESTPVDKIEIAEELPIMPLKDTVIYPHIVAPLLVTRRSTSSSSSTTRWPATA